MSPQSTFFLSLVCVLLNGAVLNSAEPSRKENGPTSRPGDGLIIVQEVSQQIPGAPRASREPLQMVISTKGARQRVDMGKMFSTIMLEDGRTLGLSHFDKTYSITTLGQTKEGIEAIENLKVKSDVTSDDKPKLTATGAKEKIAGYDAEEYTFQRNLGGHTTTVHIWIAPEYPGAKEMQIYQREFKQANKVMKVTQPGVAATMFPEDLPNGMIMRHEFEIPGGGKSVTNTVSAKFAPVDDAIFKIPKDYKEQKRPVMPAGR